MGFDSFFKKTFYLWVPLLIGIAAYFQASGVGEVVANSLSKSAPAKPSTKTLRAFPPSTVFAKQKSADPILARNPFDSITGPLDGKLIDTTAPSTLAPIQNGADPYLDPPCRSVGVSLVTASDDPDWSFASLSSPEGKSQLRRRGDMIGTAKVLNIGWYPTATEPAPRVWLNDGGSRCIVSWGAVEAQKKPIASAMEKTDKPKSKAAADLEGKIRKISDTQYVVQRSAVNQIIKNYAELAAGLRTRSTKDGVRLSGIKSSSILNELGMKNGDILHTINGYDMGDQDKALEAYAKLKTAKQLTIQMDRGGSPITVDIGIE